MTHTLNPPTELIDFIKSGKQLEYNPSECEVGEVKLTKFDSLKLGEVWVDSEQSPLYEKDPNKDEKGYYAVPAVSLTSECDDFDAEFILLWLPNEELYGTWDSDHWDLKFFPNYQWSDIIQNPVPYLNAQWEFESEIAEYFVP
jgi:hypothetical protein